MKIKNAFINQFKYFTRSKKSSVYPSLLIVEPTNACNMTCEGCRGIDGKIYDYYYLERPQKIPLGFLEYDYFHMALQEVKNYSLMVVLYLHGEPLLNRSIYKMIAQANQENMATLIATNGMLLDEENNRSLLDSGIDIIKVAVSGFTQKTYERYHIKGDVELIKSNIFNLAKQSLAKRSELIIMVDYFLFDYNSEERILFEAFCKNLNIGFSTRKGDPSYKGRYNNIEASRVEPSETLCPWLWHISVLNWNGEFLPCNQFAKSSIAFKMGRISRQGYNPLKNLWNSRKYQNFREKHIKNGRKQALLCDRCDICGIGFRPREN